MARHWFEIVSGDFKSGRGSAHAHFFNQQKFVVKRPGRQKLRQEDLVTVEIVDSSQRQGFSVGLGLAGELVAGPLGALVAGSAGGRKGQVLFIGKTQDGRRFLARSDPEVFAYFAGCLVRSERQESAGAQRAISHSSGVRRAAIILTGLAALFLLIGLLGN